MSRKTTDLVRKAIEYASDNPGSEILYLCPGKQEIVRFIMSEFHRNLAEDEVGKLDSANHQIVFQNGSRIRLMRDDDERRAYGLRFHKIIPDHAAWCSTFWRSREQKP